MQSTVGSKKDTNETALIWLCLWGWFVLQQLMEDTNGAGMLGFLPFTHWKHKLRHSEVFFISQNWSWCHFSDLLCGQKKGGWLVPQCIYNKRSQMRAKLLWRPFPTHVRLEFIFATVTHSCFLACCVLNRSPSDGCLVSIACLFHLL